MAPQLERPKLRGSHGRCTPAQYNDGLRSVATFRTADPQDVSIEASSNLITALWSFIIYLEKEHHEDPTLLEIPEVFSQHMDLFRPALQGMVYRQGRENQRLKWTKEVREQYIRHVAARRAHAETAPRTAGVAAADTEGPLVFEPAGVAAGGPAGVAAGAPPTEPEEGPSDEMMSYEERVAMAADVESVNWSPDRDPDLDDVDGAESIQASEHTEPGDVMPDEVASRSADEQAPGAPDGAAQAQHAPPTAAGVAAEPTPTGVAAGSTAAGVAAGSAMEGVEEASGRPGADDLEEAFARGGAGASSSQRRPSYSPEPEEARATTGSDADEDHMEDAKENPDAEQSAPAGVAAGESGAVADDADAVMAEPTPVSRAGVAAGSRDSVRKINDEAQRRGARPKAVPGHRTGSVSESSTPARSSMLPPTPRGPPPRPPRPPPRSDVNTTTMTAMEAVRKGICGVTVHSMGYRWLWLMNGPYAKPYPATESNRNWLKRISELTPWTITTDEVLKGMYMTGYGDQSPSLHLVSNVLFLLRGFRSKAVEL